MNKFEIVEFIPFRFFVNVRITCSFIIEIIIYIDEDTRFGVIQNDSCIIVTRAMFEINRIIVDLFRDVNLYGSNAEKMSDIIQNMELPFNALKAFSFINLMFYEFFSNKLSHQMVDSGCIK
jgi:hypothetical protein